LNKSGSLINRWSGRWNWDARAREFDAEVHKERRKAAQKIEALHATKRAKQAAAMEDSGWEISAELHKKSLEILRSPLHKQKTRDQVSGVNYFFSLTTTISPYQRQLLFDS
jgi:hypothetical protein